MNLVVITGTSKGLGLDICKKLLENDYKVLAISRTKSIEFQKLEKEFKSQIFFKEYDFNNISMIHELVRQITKEYGTIFGLVNNAALGYDGILGTMHETQISELIRVNIEAPIVLTKYISRSMLMNRKGRILNIGSIIGSTGFNGLSVYGASKSAIHGFTKSLARELGKANITVNTIAPGYMETSMTQGLREDKLKSIKRRSPLGRLAEVEDVSNSVIYLLSDSARSITGTCITIDAGSTA